MNRFSWCIPSFGDAFILLLLLLGGALAGNFLSVPLMLVLGMDTGMEWATLLSYPVVFIPPLVWALLKSKRARVWSKGASLDAAYFAPLDGLRCAVLVVIATLSLGFACDALNALMPPMPSWLEDALKSMTTGNVLINFICVSIMAPILEEWLCRGMVLRGLLVRRVKPVWAIVFSAFFFAFIHFNPWQAIPAFLLGLLFGYVYYKTGSLKLTMLMHFTNNTLALALGQLDAFKDVDNWQVLLGSRYWIFFAVSVLFTALVVLAFRRISLVRPSGNYDVLPSDAGE